MAGTATSPAPARPTERTAWLTVAAILLAIGTVYAAVRWPGHLPVGSDNDEYQLVGRALAAFEPPLVAGVEGTKYPLGYPALLAVLQWLGLPVAATALAINLVALAVTVGLVARLAGRATASGPARGASLTASGPRPSLAANPGAALAAGGLVVTSVTVWNDAYSVMPELLSLLVVAALLTVVEAPLTPRRIAALTALAVAAVLLKTMTALLVVGGLGVLWLAARHRAATDAEVAVGTDPEAARRPDAESARHPDAERARHPDAEVGRLLARGVAPRAVLLPAAAAVAAVLAGMLAFRDLPEHTTSYLATFRLRDPFDASQGTLSIGGLVRRALADVPETLADIGRAFALIDAGTALAVVVALAGLAVGVAGAHRLRRGAPLGAFTAGASLAYVLGMAAWPYHSSRFGMPLVPVAALGVGWLVRLTTDRGDEHDTTGAPPVAGPPGAAPPGAAAPGRANETPRPGRTGASLAAGGVVVALLVATSWGALTDRAEAASERLATQHAALDTLEEFAAAELDGARLVSFDYREVSHRLDRPVAPLAYTTDTSALLEQVGDADAVVMVDIHRTRNQQLERLLAAEPDRFTPLLEGEGVAVYGVEHPEP